MSNAERWLLPDGVEDILPEKAARIESIRRRLLDLYACWGYELVIPPLIEYTDSLLIGLGADIDLLTFKVVDQLSGRTMGIRADITPQTARIDAHSLQRQGVSRLCYASHVLFTKPKFPLGTRSPLQVGVELYGEQSLAADVEVVSLLLSSLQTSGLKQLNIDLGHVGIYRALVNAVNLNAEQEQTFFDLLQSKAVTELNVWVDGLNLAAADAVMLKALPALAGNRDVLAHARNVLASAPAAVGDALLELERVVASIESRFPETDVYIDLAELRGAKYHTGLVFAAFAPGYGAALANGGRYDCVGEVFGSARPATGFGIDITALEQLLAVEENNSEVIFAPYSEDHNQWEFIRALRAAGKTVINGFPGQANASFEERCTAELTLDEKGYCVKPLAH